MNDLKDINKLIELLRQDENRAILQLEELGYFAIPYLVPLLDDTSIESWLVEDLLRKSCRLEDLELLLDGCPTKTSPIFKALLPGSADWLIRHINERPERRVQSLRVLKELPLGISELNLWEAIQTCLDSSDPKTRHWASSFLPMAPNEDSGSIAWATVHQALRNEDTLVRMVAVEQLSRFNDGEVLEKLMIAVKDQDIRVRLAAAHQLKDSQEPMVIDALFDAFLVVSEPHDDWWHYENKYLEEFDLLKILLEIPTAHATVRLRDLLLTLPDSGYTAKVRICETLANREFESDLESTIEAAVEQQRVADPRLLHALARALNIGDQCLRSRALVICRESNCYPTAILIALAYPEVSETEFQVFADALEFRIDQISTLLLATVSGRVFSKSDNSTKRKLHLARLLLGEKCERHLLSRDYGGLEHSTALRVIEQLCRGGNKENADLESTIDGLVRILSPRRCENCQEMLEQILQVCDEKLSWATMTHLIATDVDRHEFTIKNFARDREEHLLRKWGWYQLVEDGAWDAAADVSSVVKRSNELEVATTLRSWVESENSTLRLGGMRYMGLLSNRPEEILDAAMTLLKDDDEEVRCEAAESLGRLMDITALPRLIVNLGDCKGSVRRSSGIAIWQICSPLTLERIHSFILCPAKFLSEWSQIEDEGLQKLINDIKAVSSFVEIRDKVYDLVGGQKFQDFLNRGLYDSHYGSRNAFSL